MGQPTSNLVADIAEAIARANGRFVFHSAAYAPGAVVALMVSKHSSLRNLRTSENSCVLALTLVRKLLKSVAGDPPGLPRVLPLRDPLPTDLDSERTAGSIDAAARWVQG